jgi:hypothetical protein
MIRSFLIAVEDWMDDQSIFLSMIKFFLIFFIVAAFIVTPIIWLVNRNERQHPCIVWSDPYPVTSFIMVGKVMVPQTHMQRACLERAEILEKEGK